MVESRVTISSITQWIGRLGRSRGWVRRNCSNMMLVALVAVSLGESLLCILHCDIWLPLMLSQHRAMAHHHMAGMDMDMDMSGMMMPDMAADPTPVDRSTCHFRTTGGAQVPFHVPPSPIHETLPIFILAVMLIIVVRRYTPARSVAPPQPFLPPPFQPPRPFALQTLPLA